MSKIAANEITDDVGTGAPSFPNGLGVTGAALTDPDADDFVPHDQLTEADVLAWVWTSVDKDQIEANLAAKIEADKNPVTASGTPWQNAPGH